MPHVNSQDQVGKLSEKTLILDIVSFFILEIIPFLFPKSAISSFIPVLLVSPSDRVPSKLLDLTQLASPDVQVSSFGASLISASSLASTKSGFCFPHGELNECEGKNNHPGHLKPGNSMYGVFLYDSCSYDGKKFESTIVETGG